MIQKLYVGGLPYSTTNDELMNYFMQAGTVMSATVLTDRITGRSRGFGFVEMASEDDAQNAINMFNGKDMGGRKIIVSIAKPQTERPRQFDRGGDSSY